MRGTRKWSRITVRAREHLDDFQSEKSSTKGYSPNASKNVNLNLDTFKLGQKEPTSAEHVRTFWMTCIRYIRHSRHSISSYKAICYFLPNEQLGSGMYFLLMYTPLEPFPLWISHFYALCTILGHILPW